jgi:hypothetical protein
MNPDDKSIKCNEWPAHISTFESSGLSKAAFCRKHNLVLHQFSYYYSKLTGKTKPVAEADKLFAPVIMTKPEKKHVDIVQIILPNGLQCSIPSHLESSVIKNIIGAII